ncbi:hypothetical protein [Singulisphaera sp. PoT]|uniref:hypothetical protein n=1 Tax=Singulisphaera sp. PoT TaxID=3411797 RepID=UPI003BF4C77C
MRVRTLRGDAAYAEMPGRSPRLKASEAKMRRNALWLHAVDSGMYDPILGRVRRYEVRELSALWELTPRAVRDGIHEARKELERIDMCHGAN